MDVWDKLERFLRVTLVLLFCAAMACGMIMLMVYFVKQIIKMVSA